jgi:hypothetical protein
MNDQSSNPGASSTNDPLSPQKASLSVDALMRRRLMLRGASGSAAALAALQPIGALATGQSTVLTCLNAESKESLCSVSGVQSAAHSFGPNITKIQAKGKTKAYWLGCHTTWSSLTAETCKSDMAVSQLFSGANNGTETMKAILKNRADSIEADFIGAYLNGATMYSASPTSTLCFPYSKAQVKGLWDAGVETRLKAQALFRGISTLAS